MFKLIYMMKSREELNICTKCKLHMPTTTMPATLLGRLKHYTFKGIIFTKLLQF